MKKTAPVRDLLVFLFTLALFLAPSLVSADISPCDAGKTICNPLGGDGPQTIQDFIAKILEGVIKIGIPIVALAIIYSGFLFVTAMGNSEKLQKAKSAFLYTAIGAAILLGSWAIAQLITETVLEIGR